MALLLQEFRGINSSSGNTALGKNKGERIMAIYELEERVYFDGAAAVDLGEVIDAEQHDDMSDLDFSSDGSEYSDTESAEYLNSIAASGMLDYANIFNDNILSDNSELNEILQDFINSPLPSEQLIVADNDNIDFNTTTFAHRTLVSGIANPEITFADFAPETALSVDPVNISNSPIDFPVFGENVEQIIIDSPADITGDFAFNSNQTTDCEITIADQQSAAQDTDSNDLRFTGDIINSSDIDIAISQDGGIDNGMQTTSAGPESGDTSPPVSINNEQLTMNNDNTELTTSDSLYSLPDSLLSTSNYQPATNNEIVFINSSVMDAEEIVDDLPEGAEVVYLTTGEDGVQQITDYLEGKTDIDTVRIISHGNDGYFVLNGEVIDGDYLTANSEVIAEWGNAMSENGDIMLYGCNLAETTEGQNLVQHIADLTGVDVAASINTTGVSGDWDLEYSIGTVEAGIITVAGYDNNLTNYLVSNTDGCTGDASLDNSLGWAINHANANVGADEITFDLSIDGLEIIIDNTLSITDDVTISGNGVDKTFIREVGDNVVFNINDGDVNTQISVTIENISIGTENLAINPIQNHEYLVLNSSNIGGFGYVSNYESDWLSSDTHSNDSLEISALHADEVVTLLSTGTAVTLQYNNDITVIADIIANNVNGDSGELTLQAGRFVLIDADITTDNSDLTIEANERIDNNGTLTANGNTIRLEANGDIIHQGNIDVSSETDLGGEVYLLGDKVEIYDNAVINADGATGGGKVRIGGGWQGGENLPWASEVAMASTAVITANAVNSGDAGSVVLWSEGMTDFEGTISADSINGQGGQIETSGKENLQVGSSAKVSMAGENGTWLLDPQTLNIVGSGGTVDPPIYANDPGVTQSVDVAAIEAVSSGTVILQATHLIDFQGAGADDTINLQDNVNISVKGGATANDFKIKFTGNNIKIKASGTGTITFATNMAGSDYNGTLVDIGSLETDSGEIILRGADGVTVKGSIVTNGANVSIDADGDNGRYGFLTLNEDSPISTNGGNLTLKAGRDSYQGQPSGILINAPINLGSGSLTFQATPGTPNTATYTINSSITSSGSFTINQPVTMGPNAAISTTGIVTFNNDVITTSSTNLVLTGSGFSFANNVTGNNGEITFRPVNADSDLTITSLPLSKLSGFSKITAGRADGTGTLNFGTDLSVTQPSVFVMGGTGGTINIDGKITATGSSNLTFNAGGTLNVDEDITTATGDISAQGTTTNIASGKSLTSTSGNITIAANTLNLLGSASSSGTLTLRPYSSNALTVGSTLHSGSSLLILPEWLATGSTKFSNFNDLYLGGNNITTAAYIDQDTDITDVTLFNNSVTISAFDINVDTGKTLTVANDLYLDTGGNSSSGTANGFITNNGTIARSTLGGKLFIYTHTDTATESNTLGTISNFTVPQTETNPGSLDYISALTAATTAGFDNHIYYYGGNFSLIITADNISKTYGTELTDTTGYTSFTVTGLRGADTIDSVTVAYLSGDTATSNVLGDYTGSITISNATGGFDAADYNTIYVAGNLTVNPKTLTVTATATATSRVYDATPDATVTLANDKIAGDNISTTYTSATFDNKNAGNGKKVTVNGISISGGDAPNYTLDSTTISTNANISKADITVSTTDVSKTYNGLLNANGTAIKTSGTLYGSDTVSGGTFAFTDKNVGAGNKTVTTTDVTVTDGNTGGNYNVTYANNTSSTITAAIISLGGTRAYDGEVTLENGIFTVNGTVLMETLTLTGSGTMADKNVGTDKAVTLGTLTHADGTNGGLASNYTLTGGTHETDITAANLSITANGQTKTEGTTFIFSGTEFTSSGLFSGNTATSVSLASGGTPGSAAAGSYAITVGNAQGTGLSNYLITYVEGVFSVTGAGADFNDGTDTQTRTGSRTSIDLPMFGDNDQLGSVDGLSLSANNDIAFSEKGNNGEYGVDTDVSNNVAGKDGEYDANIKGSYYDKDGEYDIASKGRKNKGYTEKQENIQQEINDNKDKQAGKEKSTAYYTKPYIIQDDFDYSTINSIAELLYAKHPLFKTDIDFVIEEFLAG